MKDNRQSSARRTKEAVLSRDKALIQLDNVVKVYETVAGDVTALKGVDVKIHSGEFVGIVGKSGAGKSTLVNMITGVDHITAGEVCVDGVSVHEMNEDQTALWRGRNVGVVFQSFELLLVVLGVVINLHLCSYVLIYLSNRVLHPECEPTWD